MTRLLLVNPNTDAATTASMRFLAQAAATAGTLVEAVSAPFGAPLITDEQALATAGQAVSALSGQIAANMPDGVIIAAFGDPGLETLRLRLSCPVTGIAEASMRVAGSGGRPFAVVTTTPGLVGAIEATARLHGHGESLRGVVLTHGDIHAVMADHDLLVEALADACNRAIQRLSVEAVVIGGGPLGLAAQALSDRFPIPIIAPIPAAVRLAQRRAAGGL